MVSVTVLLNSKFLVEASPNKHNCYCPQIGINMNVEYHILFVESQVA